MLTLAILALCLACGLATYAAAKLLDRVCGPSRDGFGVLPR